MSRSRPSDLGAVLRFFRFASGWSEAELAAAHGVKPGLISQYERDAAQKLSRQKLEELLAPLDVSAEAIDTALCALDLSSPPKSSASPVDPTPAERRTIRRASALASRIAGQAATKRLTANVRRTRAAMDRGQAAELWATLKEKPPKLRREAIESERKYWTWAFAERLCEESERAAAHRADRALELARLALRVTELAPEAPAFRSRLQGYAWGFVANARRVQGDLPGAEEAFLHSDRLWEAGAFAEPELLADTRLIDLKASLRRHQGRYDEALALLDRALSTCPSGEARGRLLHKKATTLAKRGDYGPAVETLRQAEILVAGSQDPRLPWLVRHNLAYSLWRAGRPAEAAALLPEVRKKAEKIGNELDLVRVLWIEGGVLADLGRHRQGLPMLEHVRRYFTVNEIAYDAAMVSLELAVLHLSEGNTTEVKALTGEMIWIFKAQRLHKEAVAALRLFCEAAAKNEATLELARRLGDYLRKARHRPELRFEP